VAGVPAGHPSPRPLATGFCAAFALICVLTAASVCAQDKSNGSRDLASAPAVTAPAVSAAMATAPAAPAQALQTTDSPAPVRPDSRAASTPADNHTFTAPFSSSKGPIDIKSDSMSLDYKGKIIVWTGNVHAIQSGSDLLCDVMHVYYGADFNDVKLIVADHNVKITQGGRWSTSDHAVMDQVARTVDLTGNPVIHDGLDQITGTKVRIYLDTQKSVVDGPAQAVIFPHKDETRDNNAANGSTAHATGPKN
jgi:lipopolysaccharide transport protein LptA